ncbi:Aldehyde ferredoxin oxidoreductase [Vulcanisaeta moutnovskia 768-28]|uniref:Aldehyde ferredoxin oxidoreductase n=1 Tax=Vulcanisaeta moutnovskia (strain 768-28) TaxID=985053 RepID=F0QYL4_VULM7|nr:aldehyde ferredoxin oxidoreductase family protein [Vulcanisaeta moutnovskia]ADY01447.1 Aldehyde ferredoxin oxidoreductase [Vulcanisaeta moutnovskia 768-28]
MALFGWVGKVLYIDLSNDKVWIENVDPEIYDKVLGGEGFAAYVIYKRLREIKGPLNPSNVLVFASGPLTSDLIPQSGRVSVGFISPLTGIWGSAHIGTRFAYEMKRAGFDAIVVLGRAERHVYVYVKDDIADIRDASKYWGLDIIETVHALRRDLNDQSIRVLAIGPAGEHLVKFSTIANEEGIGGRAGGGAVMGSKNLKAIVVKGTKPIEFAYPEELRKYVRDLNARLGSSARGVSLRKFGSAGSVGIYNEIGNIPVRNFAWGRWDDNEVFKITGETMAKTILERPYPCTTCPVACKRFVRVKPGKWFDKEFRGLGPEYETISLFGTNLLLSDLEAIARMNEDCDRLGLDTISTGNVIGFIFEAAERGLISKEIEGLRLEWGNADTVIKLIRKIAYREGIGDLLAEGVRRVSEKIGGQDFAVHVKGLEMPAHDGRAFFAHALSFVTINRGADHLGWPHMPWRGIAVPELGIDARNDRYSESEEVVDIVIKMQNLMTIYDSLVMCKYAFTAGLTVTDIVNLLKYTTGKEYTVNKLMEMGDRIWKIERWIDNQLGVTNKDDKLPRRMLTPHANRNDTKVPYIVEKWLPIYYRKRGLTEDGIVKELDV